MENNTILKQIFNNSRFDTDGIIRIREQIKPLIPENLYRYRSCSEQSIKSFLNDEIYFSAPNQFNDLFDSSLFFDYSKIESYIKPFIEKYGQQQFINSYLNLKNKINSDNWADIDLESEQRGWMKQRINLENSFNEFCTANEKNLSVFLDKISSLYIDTISENFYAQKNNLLVSCFSESLESNLMWSHYADNHKGFALSYNFYDLNGIICSEANMRLDNTASLYPVIYQKNKYDATNFAIEVFKQFWEERVSKNMNSYKSSIMSCITKSYEWSYEKEWRALMDNPAQKKDWGKIISKPNSLFLGVRISSSDYEKLYDIGAQKGVNIYKMEINKYEPTFSIEPRLIFDSKCKGIFTTQE